MIKRTLLSISTQVWDHSCVTLDKCLHLSEPVYYILLHFKITTWLVGMQTSIAAMENSGEISLKTGNRTAI